MKRIRVALVLIFLSVLIPGCSGKVDSEGYYRVKPVDDPFILPYKFAIKKKRVGIGNAGNTIFQEFVPVDIYGNGVIGMYSIGNNWRPADSLTAILFYADTKEKKILSQINVNTTHIASHFPYDFNGDNVIEVAVTYTTRDTLWLDIIDPHQRRIYRRPLVVGQDRDGNGFWDGSGIFCGVHDFNGDGFVELLVNCDVGYDLYPRKLMCVDWVNDEVVWEYPVAGIINSTDTYVEPLAPGTKPAIVFGVSSKGNAATAGDMDDQHSYVIVLDENGRLHWKRETGGVFSRCTPVLIDYDGDGTTDVLTTCRYQSSKSSSDTSTEHGGMFKIYDWRGGMLDSIDLGVGRIIKGVRMLDFDSDGSKEVFVSLTDGSITIFNQGLTPIRKAKFYTGAQVWGCGDFLGSRENQLLVATMDNKLWLLSKEFRPLAQFGEGETLHYGKSSVFKTGKAPKRYELIVAGNVGRVTYFLTIVKTPWNAIFSRNPLLAFLAAFLPMCLVVVLIWFNWYRTRKQNKFISQQRDRLNIALEDLKTAQEELIAIEEYNKTQDALRESEERFRNLTKYIPGVSIQGYRPDGTVVYWNKASEEVYGYTVREAIGKNLGDLIIPPDLKPLFEKALEIGKKVRKSGELMPPGELMLLHKKGHLVPVYSIHTAVYVEGKEPLLFCIDVDLSEQKKTEETLREQSERRKELEWIINRSPAVAFLWRAAEGWPVELVSDNVEQFGYKPQDFYSGQIPYARIVYPDDLERVAAEVLQHSNKEVCDSFTQEYRIITKAGKVRWVDDRTWIRRDKNGIITHYQGIILDITERKRAEEAQRESENRYRTLVENLPQRIFLKDENLVYVSCNQNYARDLRIKPDEIAGKTDYDFHPKELAEKYRADDKRIMESEKIEDIEERYTQDGRDVWVHTIKTPIKDEKGNIVGVLGIFRDITERKRIDAHGKARLQLLNDLRTTKDIDACLECGCKAIYEAGLFRRAVLTLHNDKKEIINLGHIGLDENVVQTARNASAPDDELSKKMTQEKYRLGHSYFIPEEAGLGLTGAPRHISQPDYVERGDSSWKEGDELFVPIIGDDNKYEGWLSVDTPFNGERPTIEIVRCLEQFVDIVTQKVREIITLEKLRQEHKALQESEEKYRALFERSAEGILVTDIETKQFKYANPAICAMLGYNEEELKRMSVVDIHSQDALKHVMSQFEAQARGEKTLVSDIPCLRKDGTTIYADIRSTNILIDGKECNVGFFSDITERKRAEERLRLFSQAVNSSVDGIAMGDLESRITYVNEAFTGMFGYSREELIGKEIASLYAEDQIPKLREAIKTTLEGAWTGELVGRRKNGELFPVALSASRVVDDEGKVIAQMASHQDITERKRAEQALLESEERFRNVSASAQDAILMMDNEGRVSFWNEAAERVFGYQAEEVLGKPLHEILGAERFHDAYRKGFGQFRTTGEGAVVGQTLELAAVRKDGTEFPIELSVSAIKLKGKWNSVGILRDITERKQAEQSLRGERDFVRSLLDTANSLVVCLDNQARITVFNRECEKVTGYTREEVIGKSWPEIFLLKEVRHDGLRNFAEWVRQHPRDMYEGPLRTKSGQIRTILWSNSALFSSDSDEITAIAVGQDITERKEAQRQLQIANQKRYNQVKEIAGGVAHEVFNALYPVTSCLDKLNQRLDLNQADEMVRNRKLIQVAEDAVQRAIETTELVTKYSKLESDKKIEDVPLRAVLEEVLLINESRIEELKVQVKLEISGDFLLKCYRPHIHSLFNNLTVNALDALAEVAKRSISISAYKERDRLKIEFSDSGSGIPPENIDKIFDAFFSTKPRTGTGLGLAISKKIVDLYDGDIQVKSSLDKGTKFTILF